MKQNLRVNRNIGRGDLTDSEYGARQRFCARLSKKQRKTCQLSHHGTVIRELYHDRSWHYGMEVCAECGRYIKFVPWPPHLWHLRDKIRSNWSKRHPQQLPLLPEPLCEHCGKNPRQWGSTWCDSCMWNLIKDDQCTPA